MELSTSKVYKCLDKKTLILGFEVIDLFVLCLMLAVLNFITGSSDLKMLFTWGPTLLSAGLLRIAKVGKPDQFLIHFLRYHFTPGVFSAWPEATKENLFFELNREEIKR